MARPAATIWPPPPARAPGLQDGRPHAAQEALPRRVEACLTELAALDRQEQRLCCVHADAINELAARRARLQQELADHCRRDVDAVPLPRAAPPPPRGGASCCSPLFPRYGVINPSELLPVSNWVGCREI